MTGLICTQVMIYSGMLISHWDARVLWVDHMITDALIALSAALATATGGWIDGQANVDKALTAPVSAAVPYDEQIVDAPQERLVAHEYGEIVWSAPDIPSLIENIDAALDDPDAIQKTGFVCGALFRGQFPEARTFNQFVRELRYRTTPYSEKVASRVLDGMRIAQVAIEKITMPREELQEFVSRPASNDYEAPTAFFQAQLGAVRASIYRVAIADLVLSRRRPPRIRLLDRVIDEWIKNELVFLQIAILVRKNSDNIPRDLMQRIRPIDIEVMITEHNAEDSIFSMFMEKSAEAAG